MKIEELETINTKPTATIRETIQYMRHASALIAVAKAAKKVADLRFETCKRVKKSEFADAWRELNDALDALEAI